MFRIRLQRLPFPKLIQFERCPGSPFIDRVTVIPDSESDSDAENNDAENERAITVGPIAGSNQPHIIDV